VSSFRRYRETWYYRYIDHTSRQVEKKGHWDLVTTKALARQAEDLAAKVKAGLAVPPEQKPDNVQEQTVRKHLDSYVKSLIQTGRDAKHVAQTKKHAFRIIDISRIERLSDLTADRVLTALDSLRERDLSARTLNAHLTAIKALAHWLADQGQCSKNPLASLRRFRFNEKADRRLIRRSLSDSELRSLIETARTSPAWRGMPGPDRAWLYALAAMTGYRREELGSLTIESFRLDQDPPAVMCEAGFTKNGKPAVQPIPDELANELRLWLASKAPGKPVFSLPVNTGQMIKADLKRAGIKAGAAIGDVDVHSLRHS